MQLILFDDHSRETLLPLTFTRPGSDLRVGILTIAEKWEKELEISSSPLTVDYLQSKYPCNTGEDNLLINGILLPEKQLIAAIKDLGQEQVLVKEGVLLAVRTGKTGTKKFDTASWIDQGTEYGNPVSLVNYPWKIFSLNGQEIEADFARLTRNRESGKLSDTVRADRPENVFVEPGFHGENFTLNASLGPVYLGKDSEIMEGSVIRGPFALCEAAVVKMGAKIYGPTTIGPFCKVGGEINNSVLQANSNKSHDGFLGNSVLGEWCNLGADTNNSNLKNNYGEVKIWNYASRDFVGTGRQFCGLIMGDHSKCGINTMFNTGTVVGVSANIFGPGFPPTFIPSFSWGGAGGFSDYKLSKALETASRVMERRELELTREDLVILEHVFHLTKEFRQ
ncbi:MAG: glucose-1-phosphate thymidylyltransferase [Bacteroidia bacterium]|nr:MAG: glucose-1-phosphate thymidylyltransferase [Bacteroidia bacterium]